MYTPDGQILFSLLIYSWHLEALVAHSNAQKIFLKWKILIPYVKIGTSGRRKVTDDHFRRFYILVIKEIQLKHGI